MTDLDIIRQECEYLNELHPNESFLDTRKKEIVKCRQEAMYLASILTKHKAEAIGEYFSKRDRTTVLHAIKTIKGYIDTEPEYKVIMDNWEEHCQEQIKNRSEITATVTLKLKYGIYVSAGQRIKINGDQAIFTFDSDTLAFDFYRQNVKYASSCVISIKRKPIVRKSEFTATNEPVEVDLK